MATKEPEIRIKVGDCADEYRNSEPDLNSEDDLIKLLTQPGWTTPKVARAVVGARVLEINPIDYLPENKPLFMSGMSLAISQVIAQRYKDVQLPNGNTERVREFVAPVKDENDAQSLGLNDENW